MQPCLSLWPQREIFSARSSAASPPDTILFHRNLSSEQIASLAPSLSLHEGWAIDCDTVPVHTGRFQERRDRWEQIAALPAAAGEGEPQHSLAAEKSWRCFWSIFLLVSHRGAGDTATLPPGEPATVIHTAIVLQLLKEMQRAAKERREWAKDLHIGRRHWGKGWWRECSGAAGQIFLQGACALQSWKIGLEGRLSGLYNPSCCPKARPDILTPLRGCNPG